MHSRKGAFALVAAWMAIFSAPANAGETAVAVAANFTAAAKEIASDFERSGAGTVLLSFGSTGALYTQIVNGAPFGAFLAADVARPRKLEDEGQAVKGSRFTYAVGRIVLWSRDPALVDTEGAILKAGTFGKLAIANPKTAPYGAAAVETLKNLGVWDAVKDKIVQGSNIAQTHQFVATGNADIGFVALSQIALENGGSKWPVPGDLYEPIAQDAVLLKDEDSVAKAFLAYLKGPEAARVLDKYGYGTP